MMMTLSSTFGKLRHYNRKNYILYLFCNFISLLLITAYGAMMFSPTILDILPEGGDSRKQMFFIFAMSCIGCVVFTIYAASLFYRMKSKELGIMMLLGASKKTLAKALLREISLLSAGSALAGTVLGMPFSWILWQLFRLLVVDSPEMVLRFDLRCLLLSGVFLLLVILAAFLLGFLYLRKTNIMEVVSTVHRNEPLRGVKKWFGPVGILLLLAGAVMGYFAPSVYMDWFSAYPPAWINLFYAPVFIGLYLFLLHVVVNGFGNSCKKKYKGLLARSMMKFQGRQTVNNMLVVTVLIGGGLFGAFYAPMLGTGQVMTADALPFDYSIHYPLDVEIPNQEETAAMAGSFDGVEGIKDWRQTKIALLAMSGQTQVEDEGNKFHIEYRPILHSGRFLSESQFQFMTGKSCDVTPGQYLAVNTPGNQDSYLLNDGCDQITNMVSREKLPITFGGYFGEYTLGDRGYYLLDDADYTRITAGLTDIWQENLVFFSVSGEDSYAFSRQYFDTFVDTFADSPHANQYAVLDNYDLVDEVLAQEKGESYQPEKISYADRDNSDFRLYWNYMPLSKTLDSHEFLKTMAVFMMMFIFIAIICLVVAMIICYTRCLTIAINNRYVFDDLKRLGASPAFLKKEVRRQASKVFSVPAILGSSSIYLLYFMIMYANDGQISGTEIAGMAMCLLVVLAVAAILYGIYRATLKQILRQLQI